ncbi:MAG: hypothetical protein ACTHMA_12740 [Thermomicrobiales bacterium]|nr:hypothetical protein [Thermomicrobiales bacterium]
MMSADVAPRRRVLFATEGDGLPAALAAVLARQVWGSGYLITGVGTRQTSESAVTLMEAATGIHLGPPAPTLTQLRGQQFDLSITLCDGLATF